MNSNVLRFFLSATLYYVVHSYTGYFLVFPDYSIIGMSGFLPPLLGIMWGPVAAFGSLVGALLSEISEWYVMPQILQEKALLHSCGKVHYYFVIAAYGRSLPLICRGD
ncbi:MAG: hypothetical protein IJ797_01705 [Selenomonadaceae bacterium]|nr:hypothetical protein [Selenomonadaceae bacterium]